MRISYRQGLISAQANFLQIGQTDTRYIDISVSPVPVVAAIAFGDVDYLIGEQRSVTNAWGPLSAGTHYLYWEVNQATGVLTRGSTSLPPVTAASVPPAIIGQMWFDTVAKVMKEFTGTRWQPVLRVFAGVVNSGAILIPAQFESQVGLNEPCTAGFIMTDGLGKAFKNSQGQFLTTDTPISSIDTGSLVKLQGAQVVVQTNENIPKFSLVYLAGGRAALASSDPSLDGSKAPLAMVTVDAYQNDAVTLVTSGQVVTNEQWDFPGTQIGKALYCSDSGVITTTKPLSWKNVKVGTIMSSNSVLLNFDQETEVPPKASGLENVGVTAPLTKTGVVEYPIIGMPRATISNDGFMNANDFARIPALETAVANKSNLGHVHSIAEVTSLQGNLDNKTDVGHLHEITDVNALPAALNNKSDIGHTHVKADITDLQPTLTAINVAIAGKINTITGSAGNFPVITSDGNLVDSSTNSATFAAALHQHAISDVINLSQVLADKSDIGHGHVIADITDLANQLSGKSNVGHGHGIADIALLSDALADKSNVGHGHILANISDVIVSPSVATGDSLVFDSVSGTWVSATLQIANVNALQAALDLKTDIGHGHVIGEVTGLQIALDSKADISHSHPLPAHTHIIAEVVDLQLALDGKAPSVHAHQITDVTGLQLALANKADLTHEHVIGDVTGLQIALDSKADVSHTHTIGALSDVDLLTVQPNDGDSLVYSNGNWGPSAVIGGGGGGSPLRFQLFALEGTGSFSGQQSIFTGAALVTSNGPAFCSYDSYSGAFTFTLNSAKAFKINVIAKVKAVTQDGYDEVWPAYGITKFGSVIQTSGPCATIGPITQSQHFRYDGESAGLLQSFQSYSSWNDSYFIDSLDGGQFMIAMFSECYNNFGNLSVKYDFLVEIQELPPI